jgi:cell division protein FtsL
MPSSTPSQRGASRSGRSSSPKSGKSAGGSSARARTGAKAKTSSSPRKSRTKKPRSSTGAGSGARRRPRSPPRPGRAGMVPVFVVLCVGLLAWVMYPALRIQYQTGRRVAGLQVQYETLKQRNQTLRAEVDELKMPEGVEKAARETLGLTKPGENVYVVMPAKAASSAPAAKGPSAASDTRDVVTALLDAVFGVR